MLSDSSARCSLLQKRRCAGRIEPWGGRCCAPSHVQCGKMPCRGFTHTLLAKLQCLLPLFEGAAELLRLIVIVTILKQTLQALTLAAQCCTY